jgi:hypothetical protein
VTQGKASRTDEEIKRIEDYRIEARQLLGLALKERAPATAESLREGTDEPTHWEKHAIVMVARLLRAIDEGDN